MNWFWWHWPLLNRCLRGFSGKNCEEIIDYCLLLNITCLNEGLCLSVIGGYQVSNSMRQPYRNAPKTGENLTHVFTSITGCSGCIVKKKSKKKLYSSKNLVHHNIYKLFTQSWNNARVVLSLNFFNCSFFFIINELTEIRWYFLTVSRLYFFGWCWVFIYSISKKKVYGCPFRRNYCH